ncbi:RNA polymerase sigma factor [Orrella sp. JC864]|uniref:RNA polymerase sigma factor n=1 Tax=Orrella sp. JC864 TaxID=3120298 RepID=UPI00142A974F
MAPSPDIDRLYAEYAERLRRFLVLKTGDDELAADLVQDCFARLMDRRGQAWPDNVLAYLYTVATHLLIDHRRNHHQARTDSVPVEGLLDVLDPAAGPDAVAEARQRLRRAEQALAELPLRTRQIFQLCRYEGRSYQQAADHLAISTSSVQKHLAMALEFIRERVEGR